MLVALEEFIESLFGILGILAATIRTITCLIHPSNKTSAPVDVVGQTVLSNQGI